MKKFKKMMALVLSMVMVLGMSINVFAENEGVTKTISVKSGSTHTYEIFQIFTGTVSEGDEDKKLNSMKYGANAKTGTPGAAVSQEDMTTLSSLTDNDRIDDQTDITNLLPFVNLESNPVATIGDGETYEAPVGYYLIRDTSDSPSVDTETQTLYLLKVIMDNIEIEPKDGTVTNDKEVKDINDTTDANAGRWQQSADWDIGDKVPFRLTATLPSNYTDYKTYQLTFHDIQSPGLTFDPNSVKVYIGDSDIAEDNSNYTVKIEGIDSDTFQVVFTDDNLKALKVTNNSVIHVEYESILNEEATIGGEGNLNTSNVTFSNNPNSEQEGEEGGKTPNKTAIVFTYKTVINKVDEDGKPLTGAEFTLVKNLQGGTTKQIAVIKLDSDGNPEVISGEGSTATSNATKFSFNGLDDGTYVLTETKTPEGYNTIAPVTFTIEATHTSNDGTKTALTELKGADQTDGEVKLIFTKNKTDDDSLNADVVNKSGSLLPSTGGIGTTIFYVIGAILVIGAGIVLITKKRMANK